MPCYVTCVLIPTEEAYSAILCEPPLTDEGTLPENSDG